MADEIIFVQALHDENDAAGLFVIETTEQNRIDTNSLQAARRAIGERLVGL